jgi:hypothetical protein
MCHSSFKGMLDIKHDALRSSIKMPTRHRYDASAMSQFETAQDFKRPSEVELCDSREDHEADVEIGHATPSQMPRTPTWRGGDAT